jgi:hypothetical protein
MNNRRVKSGAVTLALVLAAALASPAHLQAHCDGMDGPVVAAAERALASGDVTHALVWVLPGDEAEIRNAFGHAMDVRVLNEEARELADRYFFETLVRVHRAGEGAPYTGLKPAGRDLGPAISAADRALTTGSVDELEEVLQRLVRHELRNRFSAAAEAANYPHGDVEAGRAFAEVYVSFIHFVEAIYETAIGHGGHDGPAPRDQGHSH